MNVKKIGWYILSLFFLFALAGCRSTSGKTEKGMQIVTSFYPVYSMVKEIAGEVNDVRMIQSGSGIHDFEPSASDIAAIYDADVFVYHSRTLESWAGDLDPSLQESQVKVIEATEGMKLDKVMGLEEIEVDEHQDIKSLYDPHTWLDPEKVAEECQVIADQLSRLDSEHEEVYQKNASKMKEKTKQLVTQYQLVFKQTKQKTFVTQHTAFSYLAKRFGLRQLGIAGISPDQEPSPRQLTEIEDFVKTYKVETIFVESNSSSKVAETLKQATGVNLEVLNPLEADPENGKPFLENVEENLKQLSTALEK